MAKKPEPVVTVFVAQNAYNDDWKAGFLDKTEAAAYCHNVGDACYVDELPIYATADDAIKAEG